VTGQSWLGDLLAAIMLLTAAYCLSRVVISRIRHRPAEHDVDATHTVMGVSMAGMLTAGLKFLPNGLWAALFIIAGAWFGWRIIRDRRTSVALQETGRPSAPHGRHYAPMVAMCAAMVYMLLAGTALPAGGGSGMTMGGAAGGSHFTILALVLALALFGYAIWETDHFPALARVSALQAVRPAPVLALAGASSAGTVALQAPAGEPTAGGTAASGAPLSPRLAACCQIVMAVTMAYMLVLML
jgi:hypothetical protein